jgi:LmbE family N-acetylglucosaminyl deacetylase
VRKPGRGGVPEEGGLPPGIRWMTASELLPGTVLLLAPHMDDCVLGCGGTVAALDDPTRVHVAYATDGSLSPEALPFTRDRRDVAALVAQRARESVDALARLGVPEEQVHFLGFPDGRLSHHDEELRTVLRDLGDRVAPEHVLAPFRFDRHPDHLALSRATTAVFGEHPGRVLEYFVYHRSRLLPRGDIRAHLRPGLLLGVRIGGQSTRKAEALQAFRTQTTRFYPWQSRPNLTPALIQDLAAAPETFLPHDPALPGTTVFSGGGALIRLAVAAEPRLKRWKDRTLALLRRPVPGRTPSEAQDGGIASSRQVGRVREIR